MTLSKKEILGMFEAVTGIKPLSTSRISRSHGRIYVPKNDSRVQHFILNMLATTPENSPTDFYGIMLATADNISMDDASLGLYVKVSRIIRAAAASTSPHCDLDHPTFAEEYRRQGAQECAARIGRMVQNLSVRDLTNIMRGEAADRVRLYGVNETIRVLTEKIEAIKKSL